MNALDTHARDNLRFIRDTMERASAFTAVPGLGGVWMGLSALAAAGLSTLARTPREWLGVWLVVRGWWSGFALGSQGRLPHAGKATISWLVGA